MTKTQFPYIGSFINELRYRAKPGIVTLFRMDQATPLPVTPQEPPQPTERRPKGNTLNPIENDPVAQ